MLRNAQKQGRGETRLAGGGKTRAEMRMGIKTWRKERKGCGEAERGGGREGGREEARNE